MEPKKEEPKDKIIEKKGKKDMGKKEEPKELRDSFQVVAFSPDGKEIIAVGEDKYLRFWNIADGKENQEDRPDQGLAFRHGRFQGRQTRRHRRLRRQPAVYEIASGKKIFDDETNKIDRKQQITYGTVFSPDGKAVITANTTPDPARASSRSRQS